MADITGSTGPEQQGLLDRQASHAKASSSGSSSSSDSSTNVQLLMVPDAVKDQTYFLSNLSPEQLSHCMFPLGSFTKPQVRLRLPLDSLAKAAVEAVCNNQSCCAVASLWLSLLWCQFV
jgi:tRNA U34 2-thiouridine synthase MnmA/TrmU